MFADVIVDIQHEKLDKIFQYRIPAELESRLQPGMEVVVPFGKGNRQIKGYVTGFSEKCEYDLSKVKSILSISEKGMEIETRLIALAAWMKEHYGGTMIQSLKTVLPIRQKENAKVKKHLRLLLRFRQKLRTCRSNRVFRCDHDKRISCPSCNSINRHLLFFHNLQQCRLRLR